MSFVRGVSGHQGCFITASCLRPFWPGGFRNEATARNAATLGAEAAAGPEGHRQTEAIPLRRDRRALNVPPFKRKKGDKRKTRPELSHPDKNFLLFTCKINFFFPPKEMHFCYLAKVTTWGRRGVGYSLLVPVCRSDRTKAPHNFLKKNIYLPLQGRKEKSGGNRKEICQEC